MPTTNYDQQEVKSVKSQDNTETDLPFNFKQMSNFTRIAKTQVKF